jgi:transcriptional regulator with XRE-family HTH domain
MSKSYLSMILKGDRRLTPEMAERLQQVLGIHKLVNNDIWNSLYTQEVTRSNRVLPTRCLADDSFVPSLKSSNTPIGVNP